ncbi:dihydrodipicolinate synthase family protein [Natrinema sp. DC36]|uniref:dihydrodipicolinate synthase family protein n=1 Tax=Natrinema sp. DC36 TaxID=2878680 RepID=UPI001CF03D57|nr:dihydrodipicolinate synthase family protein [Natrinema sp. DC36]
MEPAILRDRFEDVAFTTAVPFSEDTDDVRRDALAKNLADLYDAGARLFVPCGNTGEYYALTDEERISIVETHVEATGDDAVVVAGAGGSVREVTGLAAAYEDAGADAVMVMHPTHTYINESALADYYHEICDGTDLGIVIYKRGPEISREVVIELAGREEVVAVKFAVNDIREFAQTVEDAPEDVTWVNGIAERYALSFAIEGATGYTTGIGNFIPEATLALFDALETGEFERAREIRRLLRPLEDLREEPGPANTLPAGNNVPVIKYGQELAGAVGGPVRTPLRSLSAADERRVEECYERIDGATLER